MRIRPRTTEDDVADALLLLKKSVPPRCSACGKKPSHGRFDPSSNERRLCNTCGQRAVKIARKLSVVALSQPLEKIDDLFQWLNQDTYSKNLYDWLIKLPDKRAYVWLNTAVKMGMGKNIRLAKFEDPAKLL